MTARLLIVAGEGSGDSLGAAVLARLGVSAFGLGGSALAAEGCELVADQADFAAMGLGSVLARAGALFRAWHRLGAAIRKERPRAALMIGFSEFNARLGPRLRARGVRVLWLAPPQIWAWRPQRGRRLVRASDAMVLLLPFEAESWKPWGALTHYVGHPALEILHRERAGARAALGAPPGGELVALFPGSRGHELRRHLPLLCEAAAALMRRRPGLLARIVAAPSLSAELGASLARRASEYGIGVLAGGSPELWTAFDVALATSGTVTLEAALARVPPVILYRPGPVVGPWVRRLLEVPFVGLPNLLLGEPAFPELLGEAATPERLAQSAEQLLIERSQALAACERVRDAVGRGLERAPSARVAELIAPWL